MCIYIYYVQEHVCGCLSSSCCTYRQGHAVTIQPQNDLIAGAGGFNSRAGSAKQTLYKGDPVNYFRPRIFAETSGRFTGYINFKRDEKS